MTIAAPEYPGATVIQGPGMDGMGNIILKFEQPRETRVLKLYRQRWPLWQEMTERFLSRFFLGKTPGNTWSRYRSELRNLELWSRHGFDVLKRLEGEFPPGIELPAVWLEYCPGQILTDVFRDPDIPWDEKRQLLRRLGSEMGRRHQLAMALSEPSLVQKHGTLDHVLRFGDRLITIDLEGSYRPGVRLEEALARELSGYLRSIVKNSGDRIDEAFQCLIEEHGARDILRDVAQWGVHGKSVYRYFSRRRDRLRRPIHGKIQVLERLLKLL